MRRFVVTLLAALTLAPAAQAEGDPRPPLWKFLTVERYTQALLQVGVLALRDQVEFTYADISADFHAGTIAMHGLTLYPQVPWQGSELCVIEAERATISSATPASWDTIRLRITLQGATASRGCIMPPLDPQVIAAGLETVAMDRFDIDLAYQIGPGHLQVTADAAFAGLAALNLNLDFAYFALKQSDDFDALFAHASLTLEDHGLIAKMRPLLPPDLANPDALAAMAEAMLVDALRPPQVPGQPRRGLGPAQQAFIAAAGQEVRRFAAAPDSITVEASPAEPVYLNASAMQDPNALFASLQPTIKQRPSWQDAIIDAALLRAALTAPTTLDRNQQLRIGKALLSGIGAPRAVGPGRALLEPLAIAGDGEAALALATALLAEDPAAAYRLALRAGEAKTQGAVGLLDSLEQRLTTPMVLAIQAERPPSADADAYAAIPAMRSRATAHLAGIGARRSYRQALYWATLASAAGDRAATKLIADIESRMRYRGSAAAEAWKAEADAVAAEALAAWLDRGLAARLGGQQHR